jgi:hypothetical protein
MNTEQLKATIRKEVNTLKPAGIGYAPISIGDPRRLMSVDYTVFKKDINEKMKLYTLKKQTPKKKPVLIGRYEF